MVKEQALTGRPQNAMERTTIELITQAIEVYLTHIDNGEITLTRNEEERIRKRFALYSKIKYQIENSKRRKEQQQ